MPRVRIPEIYWEPGLETVRLEVPWITPGAVNRLAQLVTETDTVLDVGTGGSTLFYARRCKSVLGLETKPTWAQLVRDALHTHGTEDAAKVLSTPTQTELEAAIKQQPSGQFTVVSVDTVHGYDRDAALAAALPRLLSATRRCVLVLDNWAESVLFPTTAQFTGRQLVEHLGLQSRNVSVEDYPDPKWCGKGTRILIIT
jgi:hypothetical protein